jgi:hypothetical protein
MFCVAVLDGYGLLYSALSSFLLTTAIAAIFDFIPTLFPFFAPREGLATNHTVFAR